MSAEEADEWRRRIGAWQGFPEMVLLPGVAFAARSKASAISVCSSGFDFASIQEAVNNAMSKWTCGIIQWNQATHCGGGALS